MLKTPSGVGCKEGCLFSSRLEDLGVLNGDRREVPQAVYIFWRILKATKRSFLNLYADALSSSKFYVTFVGQAGAPAGGRTGRTGRTCVQ